jgi:NAD dependent epimerase/dehydratase
MSPKAFVTGAGGFIGSHLVEALLQQGWHVRALVRYNSRSSWGWLEELRGREKLRLEVLQGDVTDSHQMMEALAGCDTVFHLAALIGIPYSYTAPDSYVATNIKGTLNLLQAARANKASRFIHTSTSEVYGTARYTPIDEAHPLQAQSPYAATKIAADKLVESFICSFSLPGVIVRPFNTYGPRQSARAVIPTIITQALKQTEVHLGSLDPIRDLTFVEDTAAGFIAAAESENAPGQVINLGIGQAVSIGELAQTIFEILDKKCTIITDTDRVRPAASEVMQLISDNSRARKLLDWQPKIPLRAGLSRTVEWIMKHQHLFHPSHYAR